MAALIYLDTHVTAWLYAGRVELFPGAARARLESSDLLVSPMVLLELQYLFEVGRSREPATNVVEALREEIGLAVCDRPFARVVQAALDQDWTRDPFDRLIVSQAALGEAPLLTKDRAIHDHYAQAVWSG